MQVQPYFQRGLTRSRSAGDLIRCRAKNLVTLNPFSLHKDTAFVYVQQAVKEPVIPPGVASYICTDP